MTTFSLMPAKCSFYERKEKLCKRQKSALQMSFGQFHKIPKIIYQHEKNSCSHWFLAIKAHRRSVWFAHKIFGQKEKQFSALPQTLLKENFLDQKRKFLINIRAQRIILILLWNIMRKILKNLMRKILKSMIRKILKNIMRKISKNMLRIELHIDKYIGRHWAQ